MKILFQGDSITDAARDKRNYHHMGNGYPKFASALIAAAHPDADFEFINFGISGNRTCQVFDRLHCDGIAFSPDIFSILIGINDVWHEYTRQNGVDADKFEMVYGLLIEELKKALPDLKIMIMEPFVLPGSATNTDEEHPGRWEHFASECVLRRQAAKRIAEKYALPFIPLQDLLDRVSADTPEGYWLADGVHPTPAGHELIKREWLKAFETMK